MNHLKLNEYRMLNQHVKKGQILFVGSSLMEGFPIYEMQLTSNLGLDRVIYNRGIGGTTTSDLLQSMDICIFDLEPSKLFINIGSNDIGGSGENGYSKDALLMNYDNILNQIKSRLPLCEVFVMAYYPINAEADFGLDPSEKQSMFATRTNANILEANEAIEQLAKQHGFSFINVNEGLTDDTGNLKPEFTVEGIHLWPNAYRVILNNLSRYL
ncbi:lysophospholipase L1-like esterase [Paenibacillus taihuensis]|uniref:Lysophospholipase L1-like esterase n=1 Tax=Paenibacillus taihuensis TaxID=1156355 RepID=A0A3D9RRE0_9BACL|nr:GDSL-type esterase/lipase family protein [Paenibacillus taihuensis]REE78544.1 lysophospholipase L1-like esterase [Paenibacillus taihuensis]